MLYIIHGLELLSTLSSWEHKCALFVFPWFALYMVSNPCQHGILKSSFIVHKKVQECTREVQEKYEIYINITHWFK